MGIDTKSNFSDRQFEQCSDDIINLSGCTEINGTLSVLSGGTLLILNGASDGYVLISDASGNTSWTAPNTGTTVSVSNGLSTTGNNIVLGGSLTGNSIINLTGNTFSLTDSLPPFDSGTGFLNLYASIPSLVVQNNSILVGGGFVSYDGDSAGGIVKLDLLGTIDNIFLTNSGTGFDWAVNSLALQTDGKIIAVGAFTEYDGDTANRIARLLSNGTLDTGFNSGTGFDNTVHSLAVQSDNKIFAAGDFNDYKGVTGNKLVKLEANGTRDTGFTSYFPAGGSVYSIAIQDDGKILAGGDFITYDGITRQRIVRILSNGDLDTTFDSSYGFNGVVRNITVQSDNKILVGGYFTAYSSETASEIIRLEADGTIDSSFNSGTGFVKQSDNGYVDKITVQSDGKILAGGFFDTYDGDTAVRIARLLSNGTLDTGFNSGTGFNSFVQSITVQTNNKILITGRFTTYDGETAKGIINLNSDGTIDSGTLYEYTFGQGLRIKDGTEADGYFLTSDASGYTSWRSGYTSGIVWSGTTNVNGVAIYGSSDEIKTHPNLTFVDGNLLCVKDNLCATTAVCTGLVRGTIEVCSPLICAGTLVCSSSAVCSPLICGTNIKSTNFQMTSGATDGYVLTSDASGNASWKESSGSTSGGTSGITWSGSTGNGIGSYVNSNTICSEPNLTFDGSLLCTTGTICGISLVRSQYICGTLGIEGYAVSATLGVYSPLIAAGNNLKLCSGAAEGYVLTSDADGLGSWAAPSTGGTGGGITWSGSTANGIGTYIDSNTICSEADMTFNRSTHLLCVTSCICALGSISSQTIYGSSSVSSPVIYGSTCVITPLFSGTTVCGKTAVCSPSICGSTSVCSPLVCGTNVKSTNFQMTSGAVDGYVLTSDASGDASWAVAGTGVITGGTNGLTKSGANVVLGGSLSSCSVINLTGETLSLTTVTGKLETGTGFTNNVLGITVQGDGKLLVGGGFDQYNGESVCSLVRLHPNGKIDESFENNLNGGVYVSVVESSGTILAAGSFSQYCGSIPVGNIIRLNSDGTINNTFSVSSTGFNGLVRAMVKQPDGKILVGGEFTTYSATTVNYFTRLESDGTLDTDFNTDSGSGFTGQIFTIVLQDDGKILVGGEFTQYNDGTLANYIIRLDSDGTIDSTFSLTNQLNAGGYVYSIALRPDGKIWVGGHFTAFGSTQVDKLLRLNSNGTLDTGWEYGEYFNSWIYTIAIQPDAKILVGGNFTDYDGTTANKILRLTEDGNIDSGWDSGTGFTNNVINNVFNIALQDDGKIFVGGSFDTYSGVTAGGIIKLDSSGSIAQNIPVGYSFGEKFNIIDGNQSEGYILTTDAYGNAKWAAGGIEIIEFALSDEVSDLTVNTNAFTNRMRFGFRIQDIRINVTTAPTGAKIIVDLLKNGTSVFDTKISIDLGEKTSVTASVPYVLDGTDFDDNDEYTVKIDQIGSVVAGVGLKMMLQGIRI